MKVNLEDVLAVYKQRQLWDTTPLQDIEFLCNGKPVDIKRLENSPDFFTAEEWLYTGLNNFDYMLTLIQELGENV